MSGKTSEMNAFNDGIAGGSTYRFLLDLTQQMRAKAGSMVRQGQTIRVKSITLAVSPENDANGGEDQYGGAQCGGNLLWMAPTAPRIAAWKGAFYHAQNLRRNAGLSRTKGYDFRVGLTDSYGSVVQNAWTSKDDLPLVLLQNDAPDGDDHTRGIFNAYNHKILARNSAGFNAPNDITMSGILGQPYSVADTSSGEDLDFMVNDSDSNFIEGAASPLLDTLPWQASFSGNMRTDGIVDFDFEGVPGHVAVFQHTFDTPAKVMNGLLALDLYYTNIDDTPDNEEFTLYWSIECYSGAKYLGRTKRRGGGRK